MNEKLSKLLAILDSKRVNYRLIRLSGKAVTVSDVVQLSQDEINEDQICKTILVKGNSGEYFGLFLEGSKKVDFAKAESEIGQKLKMASASDVLDVAGVDPGAVCPLLIGVPIIVDEGVLSHQKVNFGSGDHLFGIEMCPEDVVAFCNASIKKIK